MSPARKKPNLFMRALRRLGTVTLTLVIVGFAAGLVAFGSSQLAMRASASAPATVAEATPVSVRRLTMEDGYSVSRQFIGQVEAGQATDLSFEFGGRVETITVDEGAAVAAGQKIAELDTRIVEAERTRLEAARTALEAQLTLAEQTLERVTELRERGFAPVERVDQALAARNALKAQIGETDAALQTVALQLEKSVLLAPFEGRVAARVIDVGATVGGGQPVMRLLESGAPQVRVGLPLSVQAGDLSDVEIEIDGTLYGATLETLRPDVDPVTRTRTAIFRLAETGEVAFGQTARLELSETIEARGTWVPVRALRENAGGVWTVLTVDEDKIVRPAAVEVLQADASRAFVRGSFTDGMQLIESGPQRVTPGQVVRIAEGG